MKVLRTSKKSAAPPATNIRRSTIHAPTREMLTKALRMLELAQQVEDASEMLGGKSLVSWESNGKRVFGILTKGNGTMSEVIPLVSKAQDSSKSNHVYPLGGYRIGSSNVPIASSALTAVGVTALFS